MEDPRSHNRLYPIDEILLTALCGVICGTDGWEDIELFGKAKLSSLRGYLPYKDGIPSDDTFRRFFRAINPKAFQNRFFTSILTKVFIIKVNNFVIILWFFRSTLFCKTSR
ncbi:MAG: transposase family protein [Nitrospinota bacterium]